MTASAATPPLEIKEALARLVDRKDLTTDQDWHEEEEKAAAFIARGAELHGNRSLGRSAGLLAAVIVLVAVGSATDFQLMRHNALPTVLLFYAFLSGGRRYAMTSSARDGR